MDEIVRRIMRRQLDGAIAGVVAWAVVAVLLLLSWLFSR